MEGINRIVDIVEDHESITQTLDAIATAIESGEPMPTMIPILNDLVVTDQLSKICETITELRKKLL